MKKSCFLFLLLITLTGCSDTMAYSPERATIMQTETTTEATQNIQITTETRVTTLPPETVPSTEITPETVSETITVIQDVGTQPTFAEGIGSQIGKTAVSSTNLSTLAHLRRSSGRWQICMLLGRKSLFLH